ncbi:hypothetical protein HQ544_00345 [Candidatus Falkowbacteria bacterium]|nr:hypothetical protein [Candidatus Falkowbacteria bacterium]
MNATAEVREGNGDDGFTRAEVYLSKDPCQQGKFVRTAILAGLNPRVCENHEGYRWGTWRTVEGSLRRIVNLFELGGRVVRILVVEAGRQPIELKRPMPPLRKMFW